MSDRLTLASLYRLDPDHLSRDAVAALRSAEGKKDVPALLHFQGSELVWSHSQSCIARALHTALDVPVEDILTRGWNTLRQLRQYTDPVHYPPDQPVEHILHEHTIRSTHHPGVEVLFDGAAVGRLVFDAVLVVKLKLATLVIQAGRILEIHAGTFSCTGELKYHDALLARLSSEEFSLPGSIRIPGGLAISGRAQPVLAGR